jgi:phospholipid transport system substrate-binding protein
LHELFARYFDVDGSAEFALGRYRNTATPQQQQEFFRLYGEYTVRTFGAQLGQIGAAPFRVTGRRSSGRQAVVTTEISRPDGNRVELVWSLINRHGNFKITDLSVGGESMRVTQREEFSRWIQNNGGRFDALLAVMRQQISQMR